MTLSLPYSVFNCENLNLSAKRFITVFGMVARTLEEMTSVGAEKLRRKAASITRSWEAAKGRMKTGYGATPFGPTRKANYNSGIDAATHRTDPEKWARNWPAKMRE